MKTGVYNSSPCVILTEQGNYYVIYYNKMRTTVDKSKVKETPFNKDIVEEYKKWFSENIKENLRFSMVIGSDPEIFVVKGDGSLLPAFEFLGPKVATHETPYWDGFQAEFSTRPNSCLAFHVDSVQAGLKNTLAAARKKDPKAKLTTINTFDIEPEVLAKAAPEHVAFGCAPSFNAYGMSGIKLDGRDVPFRSAGGHIHLGIGKRTHEQAIPIVKALDAILGVACVSLFADFDSPTRRAMYGLAGEYRLPSHGIEYRVLSNAWLAHPLLNHIVFDLSRKAAAMGEYGMMSIWNASETEVIQCINNCDVSLAHDILSRNKEVFLRIMSATYPQFTNHTPLFNMFIDGVGSFIKDPHNIEANWHLSGGWTSHSEQHNVTVSKTLGRLLKDSRIG